MAWPEYSYNLSRPYPGRYTTLIVTILFVTLLVLLVFINIPLSAYGIQQGSTYKPNDTVSMPPYSFLVPASLRKDPGDFTPHTFVMGETFQTNFTAFEYTMVVAYTREDTPGSPKPTALGKIPSFAYMNYDFKACDVTSIRVNIRLPPSPKTTLTATVSCWFPVFYMFDTVVDTEHYWHDSTGGFLQMMSALGGVFKDMEASVSSATNITSTIQASVSSAINTDAQGVMGAGINIRGLDITYRRCCATCGNGPSPLAEIETYEIHSPLGMIYYDHLTCDNVAANFKADFWLELEWAGGRRDKVDTGSDPLTDGSVLNVPPHLPVLISNTVKAFYHAVRLDLGIIRPNQIYNSPTRFNESIIDIPLTDPMNPMDTVHGARAGRDAIGNVELSDHTTRVPEILYLKPVLTRKPLGQAIGAVFVSTFSMLTAIWKLFDFVASSLVTVGRERATYCPCPSCQSADVEAAHHVKKSE